MRWVSPYISPRAAMIAEGVAAATAGGLPRITGGSASALPFSRPAQRSLHVTACALAKSLTDPFTSAASTASLPPRPLRLLPAGTTSAGWDSHPLGPCTFARHTEICGLDLSIRLKEIRLPPARRCQKTRCWRGGVVGERLWGAKMPLRRV